MQQVSHPRRPVGLQQRIAQPGRLHQRSQHPGAIHKLLVEQASAGQLVLVHRGLEILHGAFGGRSIVHIGVVHKDALEARLIREEQAVVESVAGIDVVAHGDVRQFHGDHRGNGFLAGQTVDQPLADEDGVAHGGGFNGVGEQDAAMNLVSEGEIVRHHQVDDDLAQHLFFIAAGIERRYQASFNQAVDNIVLGLRDPHARGL